MEKFLSHFKFARFQFLLRALDSLHLPVYKGSTLRGGFGHAFKKVVCVSRERNCNSCLLKARCVYSYVFETPPPSDTSKMRKYPYAPHPFVITPPLEEKREYREMDTLCFDLTLIGKSIDFLPYFIYTFDELGRMGIGKGKGKYTLENVGQRTKVKGESDENTGEGLKVKNEETTMVYSGKEKTLRNNFEVLNVDDLLTSHLRPSTFNLSCTFHLSPSTLDLHFVTPTRLKFDGNLSPRPEFHILFRNLLRRISLLSYFHCDQELDLDFKGLIEKSKGIKVKKENLSWIDWERYSKRQETRMKMGGFIGSITFEGMLEPFLSFLLLGEYIHVGKGTSFGLGRYTILNLEFVFTGEKMPESFEELPIWQKARQLVKYTYLLTKGEKFSRDFSLVDQIRRSSTSVMFNTSEGFERGSNAEFIQFLYIAKGSAGETRAQLYVALDQDYISQEEFQKGVSMCKDVSGQLSGLIDYLKGSRLKGEKFRRQHKSMREAFEEMTKGFNIQNSRFNKTMSYSDEDA